MDNRSFAPKLSGGVCLFLGMILHRPSSCAPCTRLDMADCMTLEADEFPSFSESTGPVLTITRSSHNATPLLDASTSSRQDLRSVSSMFHHSASPSPTQQPNTHAQTRGNPQFRACSPARPIQTGMMSTRSSGNRLSRCCKDTSWGVRGREEKKYSPIFFGIGSFGLSRRRRWWCVIRNLLLFMVGNNCDGAISKVEVDVIVIVIVFIIIHV